MGLFRKRSPVEASPKAVTAASLPLSGPNKVQVGKNFKAGTDDWQNEVWYFYDAVGEFRSAVTWIANAVSRAGLHAADVDEQTGEPGEITDDDRVQQIARAVLGGAEVRTSLMKMLAVQWQVPGESFIIVRPQAPRAGVAQPDKWLVLSGRRVTYNSAGWSFMDPETLQMISLTESDLLIRVWSPHPDNPIKADSAGRPALPILREIEKTSQAICATLDSRLATAGVLAIPSEASIPGDGTLSENLTDAFMEAAAESIRNPGQSAARVPIVVEMPGDQIAAFAGGFIDFATTFDSTVGDQRQDALVRLAATLDMPNETAEGSTNGMNHWGAWQVEETTYKIYIQPLLDAIGDALTREWFRPALSAVGVADPDRYVLAWDTSQIVSRPDRAGELKELWDDVLISDDYRRQQAGIPDDAVPGADEERFRRLYNLVAVAPTLLADPKVGQELFGFEIAPAATGVDPAEAQLEAGESGTDSDEGGQTRALPSGPDDQSNRPVSTDEVPEGLVAAAEILVFDALSRAGARLLTREHRGQFASTPKHELYLTLPVTEPGRLLEGSFAWTDSLAEVCRVEPQELHARLQRYAKYLLTTQERYDRTTLRLVLRNL